MALLDGELPDEQRTSVEAHVRTCPHCNEELHRFEELSLLTHRCKPSPPPQFSWSDYYRGVCRKLETRASWTAWSVVSLLLVVSGILLFFGLSHSALALVVGVTAIACGASLIGLSYFCNCCHRKHDSRHYPSV
jgi:anti-sigma factor RsiW